MFDEKDWSVGITIKNNCLFIDFSVVFVLTERPLYDVLVGRTGIRNSYYFPSRECSNACWTEHMATWQEDGPMVVFVKKFNAYKKQCRHGGKLYAMRFSF